jgi:hypothetical protein
MSRGRRRSPTPRTPARPRSRLRHTLSRRGRPGPTTSTSTRPSPAATAPSFPRSSRPPGPCSTTSTSTTNSRRRPRAGWVRWLPHVRRRRAPQQQQTAIRQPLTRQDAGQVALARARRTVQHDAVAHPYREIPAGKQRPPAVRRPAFNSPRLDQQPAPPRILPSPAGAGHEEPATGAHHGTLLVLRGFQLRASVFACWISSGVIFSLSKTSSTPALS